MKKIVIMCMCCLMPLFCSLKPGVEKQDSKLVESKLNVAAAQPDTLQPKKPKIVIFTSKGGNGHMSACDTLKDILPNCEIKLINPIYDFFHTVIDGEAFYNALFQNGWISTANFLVSYPGKTFLKMRSHTFKKRFLQFLDEEKPDMLISVIPLINYPAAWAANQRSIPFMVITLDADLDLWLLNMERAGNLKFTMTVQAKTPRIEKQLAKKHVPVSCIREVGAPLRKEFFLPKNKPAIRKEWNIPEGKKVVLLMRGGTGSTKLVDYVKTLVKLDKPIHLLVCIGRNEKLVRKLNRIKCKKGVSFSIVPFTPKIPDLMAISDLLISQPSPNVCNEAMHVKLPILVDMSGSCLYWEKATVDWLKLRGAGQIFKHMRHLNKLVVDSLEKGQQDINTHNLKPFPVFNTEIRDIITNLLPQFNNDDALKVAFGEQVSKEVEVKQQG